ncbi:D-xylose-proton symporter [Aquisphaera giovannonii]|uniref:D-xylose-proton symporter n=1 Tax=Aquisphaera giovannonii TaxID=406548 RepID=A0A5B9W2M2_9BACT|nr:sugar porter family MFS transporter [Aquisphaera giovannonii]QEH34853.1 D-xylose-proton symporter [Aquisphaera giovannonii]
MNVAPAGEHVQDSKLSAVGIRSAAVAALGGLLFGFDTAVISGAEKSLQRLFELDSFWLGFTVATALIGTIVGSVAIERPADRMGRRKTLFLLAVLYFVSSLGSALAGSWWTFVVMRFVGGLAIGGASVVAPMYIAEISPSRLRGRLVAINQLNIVVGILLSFVSNYLISLAWPPDEAWRWMLGVVAIPSAAFFALLFGIVESPRWLVKAGRAEEARAVLARLGHADVPGELAAIEASLSGTVEQDALFQRRYAWPIFLAWAIAMFNQLSGINALMYYAPRIFEMAGAGESSALMQSIAVGGTNLVFTLVGMALIDFVGRRKLIIWGSVGYMASLGAVAWAFHHYGGNFDRTGGLIVLAGLLAFQASHAFSQGAVIWVFIAEIFPNAVRAKGQALGSFTHWFMAALVSWTFPAIARWSGAGAFGFFAAMMGLQLVFALTLMPETKGGTLEDIEARLA